MHRFFVDDSQIDNNQVTILGNDVRHISIVLKLDIGEKIVICNGQGKEYCCIIERINRDSIILSIDNMIESNNELRRKIYLFQGIPKLDKMELIIQKAVELGVYEVIPVSMTRSVAKINSKNANKKIERWNKIAESAAKQSHRAYIPKVKEPIKFGEAINKASELDMIIVPYENATDNHSLKRSLLELEEKKSVGIFIGPEGGFDESEIHSLIECDAQIVTLGKRILRTETASLAVLSIIMFYTEEYNNGTS